MFYAPRQLESIAYGAAPVHLVAVFGIDPKTAMHYATSARELLAETIASDRRR